jgi:hypothetical protein
MRWHGGGGEVGGGVDGEGDLDAELGDEQPGGGGEDDLGDDGDGPHRGVGVDELVVFDGVGDERRRRGVEQQRPGGESERDEVGDGDRAVHDHEEAGEGGSSEVGADHDPTVGTRSTTSPATGPRRSTGSTSNTTVPATPSPDR